MSWKLFPRTILWECDGITYHLRWDRCIATTPDRVSRILQLWAETWKWDIPYKIFAEWQLLRYRNEVSWSFGIWKAENTVQAHYEPYPPHMLGTIYRTCLNEKDEVAKQEILSELKKSLYIYILEGYTSQKEIRNLIPKLQDESLSFLLKISHIYYYDRGALPIKVQEAFVSMKSNIDAMKKWESFFVDVRNFLAHIRRSQFHQI